MNEDKSLETTVEATIYQNEKNADTLVFLLPRLYEEVNLANCIALLRYILPDGTDRKSTRLNSTSSLQSELLPVQPKNEHAAYGDRRYY